MAKRRKRKVNAKGRNEGLGQYLPIPYSMAQHPAWRSLSGSAVKVWIEIRCRYNGRNNGELSLSLREAASLLGMSQTTAKRAFDELIEAGFLIRRHTGSWYGRQAAEYITTDRSFEGAHASRNWLVKRGPAKPKLPT